MKKDSLENNTDRTVCDHLRNEPSAQLGLKLFIIPALLVAAAFGFSGCAEGNYARGYGTAYYAPDYGPYYGDYGYDGYPYWGSGPYSGGEIIVGETHHRGHYGGHHFTHESRGAGMRGAAPSGASHGMSGGGRHRR